MRSFDLNRWECEFGGPDELLPEREVEGGTGNDEKGN